MEVKFIASLFLVLSSLFVSGANEKQAFDRSAFYNALASESLDVVNAELEAIEKSTISIKEGYEGSLLMKKAGLVMNPGNKLNLFKSGQKKLENAITKDGNNAELRFLRLMIQENAPRILNYRKHIQEDSKIIQSSYKTLPPVVQKVIAEYSRNSKVLKPVLS